MIIFADLDGKGFVNNETVELNICIDSWLIVQRPVPNFKYNSQLTFVFGYCLTT